MTPNPSDASLVYMRQLDGLRALAVVAVIYTHSFEPGSIESRFALGPEGVRLFFVLSGFLITSILLNYRQTKEQGHVGWRRVIGVFYLRRYLRLSPPYYAYLLAGLFLLPGLWPVAGYYAVYLQNFLFVGDEHLFNHVAGHFWTLAVEEQFYLVCPFLVLFAPRRALPWVMGGLVVASPVLRVVAIELGATRFQVSMMMPTYFDTLGLGGLLALLAHGPGLRGRAAHRLANGALIVGLPLFAAAKFGVLAEALPHSLAYSAYELSMGLVFVWVVSRGAQGFGGVTGAVLSSRPLVYVGRISYGVYVYHLNTPGLLQQIVLPRLGLSLPDKGWLTFAVVLPATIGIAALSWLLIERPVARFKPRLRRHRGAGVQGGGGLS